MKRSIRYAYKVACTMADPEWDPQEDESIKESLKRRFDAASAHHKLPTPAFEIAVAVIRLTMFVVLLARITKPARPVVWPAAISAVISAAVTTLLG